MSYSWYWTGTSLQWRLMWWNIIKKRLMSYSRYWTGTSLQTRLMRGNIVKKILMSYSWYWTATSLQWRLMRKNIIKKGLMSFALEKTPCISLSCKLKGHVQYINILTWLQGLNMFLLSLNFQEIKKTHPIQMFVLKALEPYWEWPIAVQYQEYEYGLFRTHVFSLNYPDDIIYQLSNSDWNAMFICIIHSPLQKCERTGVSFIYWLDGKSEHFNWNSTEW